MSKVLVKCDLCGGEFPALQTTYHPDTGRDLCDAKCVLEQRIDDAAGECVRLESLLEPLQKELARANQKLDALKEQRVLGFDALPRSNRYKFLGVFDDLPCSNHGHKNCVSCRSPHDYS